MRHLSSLLFVTACGAASTPPAAPARDAEVRIAAMERGLAPVVQVRGEEQRFSIADRMREYEIPAVSIAVFDNYELQRAKAYGVVEAGGAEQLVKLRKP